MGQHCVPQGEPLFVPSPFLFRDAPKTSVPKSQLGFNLIEGSLFPSVSSKSPRAQCLPVVAVEHRGKAPEACECVGGKSVCASTLTFLCAARPPLLPPCSNFGYRD